MALCSLCSSPLMAGKMICVKCGAITVSDSPGGSVRDEDFVDVMDVEAMAVARIVTGEWWDEAFNGGFVPTFSMLLGGSPGAGKAVIVDTPIALANGSWKSMGEIVPGDVVLDNVHQPTRVVGCSEVMTGHVCYDVHFSAGPPIIADADHLWVVDVGTARERLVLTTEDVRGYLRQGRRIVLPEDREEFARRRLVVGVFPTRSVPVRCISVDSPSRLYLAGRGLVPTHNTTWLLQVGAVVARVTGRPTYFISAEQDKGELKMTIDRLQLPLERGMLRVLKKMGAGGSIDEEIFKTAPPGMLILDSVTALCGKDKDAQVAVGRLYKQYSVKYKAPSFLISHMTKEGDLAGLLTLQHDVDAIASFFPSENERSRFYGQPVLELHKYRFGPTHKEYQLIMTPLGLMPAPKEKQNKRAADMDEAIELAMKAAQEKAIADAMQRELARRAGTTPGGPPPGETPGAVVSPGGPGEAPAPEEIEEEVDGWEAALAASDALEMEDEEPPSTRALPKPKLPKRPPAPKPAPEPPSAAQRARAYAKRKAKKSEPKASARPARKSPARERSSRKDR